MKPATRNVESDADSLSLARDRASSTRRGGSCERRESREGCWLGWGRPYSKRPLTTVRDF
eukprot:40238-Rhodomonas_salina.1